MLRMLDVGDAKVIEDEKFGNNSFTGRLHELLLYSGYTRSTYELSNTPTIRICNQCVARSKALRRS